MKASGWSMLDQEAGVWTGETEPMGGALISPIKHIYPLKYRGNSPIRSPHSVDGLGVLRGLLYLDMSR
jgi:hypothetical protein